jgi:hypothetical protein
MKKVLLSLMILTSLVCTGYCQGDITEADLKKGILIDTESPGQPMSLTNGEYNPSDKDEPSFGLNESFVEFDGNTAVLVVMQYAGGFGNGCLYRIACATKKAGKTYIKMGDGFAESKALIVSFGYSSKTVGIAMYNYKDDVWLDIAPLYRTFVIINGNPVSSNKPYNPNN